MYFYGDSADIFKKKEKVIYMSNHQSSMDWMVANILAARQGSLNNVRFVIKDSIRLLPLYGFYFDQHGCIFVKRGDFKESIMKEKLASYQSNKIPTWMVIFPEGTRFNPDDQGTLEKSQAFATTQGIEPFHHVLVPRIRGFKIALDRLKSNIDAVYDVTVIYSGTIGEKGCRLRAPSMFDILSGEHKSIHIHVSRIPIAEVPQDVEELKPWLYDRYRIKDSLLRSYYDKQDVLSSPVTKAISFTSCLISFLYALVVTTAIFTQSWCLQIYCHIWLVASVGGYAWVYIRGTA